jgi:hypothetical protein
MGGRSVLAWCRESTTTVFRVCLLPLRYVLVAFRDFPGLVPVGLVAGLAARAGSASYELVGWNGLHSEWAKRVATFFPATCYIALLVFAGRDGRRVANALDSSAAPTTRRRSLLAALATLLIGLSVVSLLHDLDNPSFVSVLPTSPIAVRVEQTVTNETCTDAAASREVLSPDLEALRVRCLNRAKSTKVAISLGSVMVGMSLSIVALSNRRRPGVDRFRWWVVGLAVTTVLAIFLYVSLLLIVVSPGLRGTTIIGWLVVATFAAAKRDLLRGPPALTIPPGNDPGQLEQVSLCPKIAPPLTPAADRPAGKLQRVAFVAVSVALLVIGLRRRPLTARRIRDRC